MSCKHKKIVGNTTKYFVCGITNKQLDEKKCSKCMLKVEDNNIKNMVEQVFGRVLRYDI